MYKLMKPKKVNSIEGFNTGEYVFEVKLDGGSGLLVKKDDKLEVYHGSGERRSYRYPDVRSEGNLLKDGVYACELCVFNDDNVTDFSLFQRRQVEKNFLIEVRSKRFPIVAMVYDVLFNGKEDVRDYDLLERKKILEKNVVDGNHIRLVEFYENVNPILTMRDKIEGVVIKHKYSKYLCGKRDKWYKYRFNREETVKIIDFEEWSGDNGLDGVILITEDGRRVNLAGRDSYRAKEMLKENGEITVEICYHSKTEKGFRFPVVKRILGD